MRASVLCLLLAVISAPCLARGVTVKGYVKPSTGTYVAPHHSTAPDSTRLNNYSTKGNVNPYTGKAGSKPILKPVLGGR